MQREATPRNKCRVPWQQREFPSQAAGSGPCQASSCEAQTALGLGVGGWSKDGRKATPRLGLRSSGTRGIHPFPGAVSCALAQERVQPRGRELGPALPSPGASAPGGSSAAQRSAAGPFPAAAARPMAQSRRALACSVRPRLPEPGRQGSDAPATADGWNPAPGPSALTARVLHPETALAWWVLFWRAGRLVPLSPWASSSRRCSCLQMHPERGLSAPHPQLHASRSEIWALGRPEGRLAPGPRIREARTHL